MLTRVKASEEQINKILKKQLRWVFSVEYSQNGNKGFIWCTSSFWHTDHHDCVRAKAPILQWRMNGGNPSYFSLQKGDIVYDVDEPQGKLYERLKKIGDKAIRDFWKGGAL